MDRYSSVMPRAIKSQCNTPAQASRTPSGKRMRYGSRRQSGAAPTKEASSRRDAVIAGVGRILDPASPSRLQDLHVAPALERRGIGAAGKVEAAPQLVEGFVVVVFEPARDTVAERRQLSRTAAQQRRNELQGGGARHQRLDGADRSVD